MPNHSSMRRQAERSREAHLGGRWCSPVMAAWASFKPMVPTNATSPEVAAVETAVKSEPTLFSTVDAVAAHALMSHVGAGAGVGAGDGGGLGLLSVSL